jgi:hypothetical protein
MSQRCLRWGLCASALFGLPLACGGSDSGSPGGGGSGAIAGSGVVAGNAGVAQAGQNSKAGAGGEVANAGAPNTGGNADAGGTGPGNAGAGGAVAGSANGGQTSTAGGGGSSNAGANNGGSGGAITAGSGGTGVAGANNGGGGASSAGANNGGGGASNAGAGNGGGGASSGGGGGSSSAGAGNGGGGASSGGGGQGGSAVGHGGSGGSGGAAQIGCGSPNIVDDLEDGNGTICPHALRSGGWYVATSSAGVSTSPVASTLINAYALGADAHHSSTFGMRFAGSGFSTDVPWAAIGTSVSSTATPYDASGYTSVRFWAKSRTTAIVVRFNMSTTETRSTANGGTCTGTKCDDSYGKFINIGTDWAEYEVIFSLAAQSGWGTQAVKNMAHLWTLEFNYTQKPFMQNTTNPADFDFLIDDLRFY